MMWFKIDKCFARWKYGCQFHTVFDPNKYDNASQFLFLWCVGNIQGTIDDMIVAVDTGEIQYLVVDATLAESQRWIPVLRSFIQWDAANGAFVINANPTTFQQAPFFENGQYPDTTTSNWHAEFDTFWQNNGTGTGSLMNRERRQRLPLADP